MADRYWVGGTATWDNNKGTKWALTDGGGAGQAVPTTDDDVFFTAASGAVTVSITNAHMGSCKNLNFTGFTGTVDGTGSIYSMGNITLSNTTTFSAFPSWVILLRGDATITSNGAVTNFAYQVSNLTSSLTLADNLVAYYIQHYSGNIDFNNKNVTLGSFYSNASGAAGEIWLGSGLITCSDYTGWYVYVTPGDSLILHGDTATIKLTYSGITETLFDGGGFTYHNLWVATSGAGKTLILSDNTFDNIIADSGRTILFTAGTNNTITTSFEGALGAGGITIESDTPGTPFTLTKIGGGIIADAFTSIKDSTASPANTWYAPGATDVSGNSGWVFAVPPVRYWVNPGGSGDWDAVVGTKWAYKSGGAGGEAVPTSADDVYFDDNSGLGVVVTSTANGFCKGLDFTDFTGTFTSTGSAIDVYGDITLATTTTYTTCPDLNLMSASAIQLITSNGMTYDCVNIQLLAAGGAKLIDNFVTTGSIVHGAGTFDLNDKNFTAFGFDLNSVTTRSLLMKSGTLTITGSGNSFIIPDATNLTLTCGTSTLKFTYNGAGACDFYGAGKTFYNFWDATTGVGKTRIYDDNIFNDIKVDSGNTIQFWKTSNNTVTTFHGTGAILESTNAGVAFTLTKAGGGVISDTFASIQDSTAMPINTWYAPGATDVSGNTNWLFIVIEPTATPGASTYLSAQFITLASLTPGALVYYTLDGSVPSAASNLYTIPVFIGLDRTIKAIAILGAIDSTVLTAAYVINYLGKKYVYQCTSLVTPFTGTLEPTWPTVLGNTVVDDVGNTWTCMDIIVQAGKGFADNYSFWTAATITVINTLVVPNTYNGFAYLAVNIGGAPHQTGGAEPAWPVIIGDTIADGDVTWECVDVGGRLSYTYI